MCPLQRTPPTKVLMCCLPHWSYRCSSSSSSCWPSTAWGENTDTHAQETKTFFFMHEQAWEWTVSGQSTELRGKRGNIRRAERWLLGKQLHVQEGSRSATRSGQESARSASCRHEEEPPCLSEDPDGVFSRYLIWSPFNIRNNSVFYTDSKTTERLWWRQSIRRFQMASWKNKVPLCFSQYNCQCVKTSSLLCPFFAPSSFECRIMFFIDMEHF